MRLRESTSPMGGIQVVFCGDFFQLPPVMKQVISSDTELSTDRFAFQSPIWKSLIQQSFLLTEVFRQSDPSFIEALEHIRQGHFSGMLRLLLRAIVSHNVGWFTCLIEAIAARFRPCFGRQLDCSDGILPTKLYTHKYVVKYAIVIVLLTTCLIRFDVDSINLRELSQLPGDIIDYESRDYGGEYFVRMLHSNTIAKKRLQLKIGAQVS